MPACPKCKNEWVWDWEQDSYRDKKTGKFCVAQETPVADHDTVEILFCHCWKVLGFALEDDDGLRLYNCPEWQDVDWENEANSYDPLGR